MCGKANSNAFSFWRPVGLDSSDCTAEHRVTVLVGQTPPNKVQVSGQRVAKRTCPVILSGHENVEVGCCVAENFAPQKAIHEPRTKGHEYLESGEPTTRKTIAANFDSLTMRYRTNKLSCGWRGCVEPYARASLA